MCNTFAHNIVARHIYNKSPVIFLLVPLGFFLPLSHSYTYFAAAMFIRSENNICSAFEIELVWIPISSVQPNERRKKPEYHNSNGWWQIQNKNGCFVAPIDLELRKTTKSTIVRPFFGTINLKKIINRSRVFQPLR